MQINYQIKIMKKPTIAIIIDWQERGDFSASEHFVIRSHYVKAVRLAGGTPWLIPYCQAEEIDEYLSKIDGLVVPGGQYKTPDQWYVNKGESSPYEASPRFIFEENFIKKALEKDLPIFGICAGMQVMGGILGCKLTPNIHKYLKTPLKHYGYQEDHQLVINKNSPFANIFPQDKSYVNSNHNEAIVEISDKIEILAKADDGCIEAIVVKNKKFAVGVQWHPEFSCHEAGQIKQYNFNFELFKEFIRRANEDKI